MSLSLQERELRAEGRIESLLLGLDETVRHAYESLLERAADHATLTPEQRVARLEGFHDYIITREETHVEHPSLSEYILVKQKFGDMLLSFGNGKHRIPIEGEDTVVGTHTPVVEDVEVDDNQSHDDSELHEQIESALEQEPEVVLVGEVRDVDVENLVLQEDEEATQDEDQSETLGETFDDEVLDTNEVPVFTDEDDVLIDPDSDTVEETESDVDRITPSVISDKDFAYKIGGYSVNDVDEYLDDLVAFFDRKDLSAKDYEDKISELEHVSFPKKSFKKGFIPIEVDEFLVEVTNELRLRAKGL